MRHRCIYLVFMSKPRACVCKQACAGSEGGKVEHDKNIRQQCRHSQHLSTFLLRIWCKNYLGMSDWLLPTHASTTGQSTSRVDNKRRRVCTARSQHLGTKRTRSPWHLPTIPLLHFGNSVSVGTGSSSLSLSLSLSLSHALCLLLVSSSC